VIEVNRAFALAQAYGPQRGLDHLAPLLDDPVLTDYPPMHAAHAELLRRVGDTTGADAAFGRAIALTDNAVQRAGLERRRATLSG
jgi:RNA polymerase sigma-70 factor, ECF subfamily